MSEFSDFIRKATPEEKREVYETVIDKAIKKQNEALYMPTKRTVSQCVSADFARGWNACVDEINAAPTPAHVGWISIEDRKPEIGQRVIAHWLDGSVGEAKYYGDHQIIKHWQEMPPPPEEQR